MTPFHIRAQLKFFGIAVSEALSNGFKLGRTGTKITTHSGAVEFSVMMLNAMRAGVERNPDYLPVLVKNWKKNSTSLVAKALDIVPQEQWQTYCEMAEVDGMEGALAALDDYYARVVDKMFPNRIPFINLDLGPQ